MMLMRAGSCKRAPSATVANCQICMSQGKVEALVKLAYSELADTRIDLDRVFDSHTGVAHTRWATHGSPSPINSHPQVVSL